MIPGDAIRLGSNIVSYVASTRQLGESQAIRQMLGPAKKLPDFVGGFGTSQYRPERAEGGRLTRTSSRSSV